MTLVAFEGIDGVGKTGIALATTVQLKAMGLKTAYIAFPSKEVRFMASQITDPTERLYLYAKDHLGCLDNMDKDTLWIMDRSYISMFAYNVNDCIRITDLSNIQSKFDKHIIDLCFLVEAPFDICNQRIKDRIDSGEDDTLLSPETYARVTTNYRKQTRLWSHKTWHIDNCPPYGTFGKSVERAIDGIIKVLKL